jgi:pimeloyl-ACP methyl ester carboxylesterase
MPRLVLACVTVVVLVAAAACASSEHPVAARRWTPSIASPSPGPSVTSAPPLTAVVTRCGPPDVSARTFAVTTSDRIGLAAAEVGTGRRGVVLVPELGSANLCGWWTYAAYLAQHGFHVLLFDHRCTGESTCASADRPDGLMLDIAATVARLKRDGAHRVALMGASQGASESLIAGSATLPIAGIVALSADELDDDLATKPYASSAVAAGSRIRVPTLIAVGGYDPDVTVADTKALAASVSASRLVVVPKTFAHGWQLLDVEAGKRPAISDSVVAFLRSVLS